MVQWLFSLLFYCESGFNQYAGQKTLTDNFGASPLLLELSCFRNIVLPCHLRIAFHVFVRSYHLLSKIISLAFFCFLQFMKKSTFLNIKLKGWQPIVPSSPNQLLVILFKVNRISWWDLNFPIIWRGWV